MFVCLFLTAITVINAQPGYPDCGWLEVNNDPSVIGGIDAKEGEIPWQLSLEIYNETNAKWRHTCGSILISDTWALSAAHCLYGRAGPFRIVAGQHDRGATSGNEQIRTVAKQILHPRYTHGGNYPDDIALIQFNEPVDLSSVYVGPVCLPTRRGRVYTDNPDCWISGWGKVNYEHTGIPDILQKANIDIISNDQCRGKFGDDILDSHICMEDTDNDKIGACSGDSGGPISCRVDALYEAAGIASWVRDGCDVQFPSVYTRVSHYLDWIEENSGVKRRPPPTTV